MRMIIAIALCCLAFAYCSAHSPVTLSHGYPSSCKGHGRVVAAENMWVDPGPDKPNERRTRMTCEDGTVAITKD